MRRRFVPTSSTVSGVGALPGLDPPGMSDSHHRARARPSTDAAVSLFASSLSKTARAAAQSAARSASHPADGECGVDEPAMAPIIASLAPPHHGQIGRSTRSHPGLASVSPWRTRRVRSGQESNSWRFLAKTAIVWAYSSLGLNSTTWVPGSPISPVWPGPA